MYESHSDVMKLAAEKSNWRSSFAFCKQTNKHKIGAPIFPMTMHDDDDENDPRVVTDKLPEDEDRDDNDKMAGCDDDRE